MNTHIAIPKVVLLGASPDTGNLGVSALSDSTLYALASGGVQAVSVFDHGRGVRRERKQIANHSVEIELLGATPSLRVYRPESTWNIRVAAMLGGAWNPAAQAITHADAVLAVAGGDSFTDLYGARRFWTIVNPMLAALESGRPLILLPQTYGPFHNERHRRIAEHIVGHATLAWARDKHNYDLLRELNVGDDASRLRCGVDMAFGLPTIEPQDNESEFHRWLNDSSAEPTIGFNISGLVYNRPETNPGNFNIHCDYPSIVDGFLRKVLTLTSYRIMLMPHVEPHGRGVESDLTACEAARARLGDLAGSRVVIAPAPQSPSHAKGLIAKTHWFAGTRMHSTIASLSSGVPTGALAYSHKTKGVFATAGQGDAVIDLRTTPTEQCIDGLWNVFQNRESARASLARELPGVMAQWKNQRDEVLGLIYTQAASRQQHAMGA